MPMRIPTELLSSCVNLEPYAGSTFMERWGRRGASSPSAALPLHATPPIQLRALTPGEGCALTSISLDMAISLYLA